MYVGTAFHHAGLTSEERNNVKLGYGSGALKAKVSEIDKFSLLKRTKFLIPLKAHSGDHYEVRPSRSQKSHSEPQRV